jgi:hypothetical protein
MEHLNISQTIKDVCKEKNIPYYSPHLGQAIVLMDDVNKLEDIFLRIKGVISDLEKIKVKHQNMEHFTNIMNGIIKHLYEADKRIEAEAHILVTMKKKLKKMGR